MRAVLAGENLVNLASVSGADTTRIISSLMRASAPIALIYIVNDYVHGYSKTIYMRRTNKYIIINNNENNVRFLTTADKRVPLELRELIPVIVVREYNYEDDYSLTLSIRNAVYYNVNVRSDGSVEAYCWKRHDSIAQSHDVLRIVDKLNRSYETIAKTILEERKPVVLTLLNPIYYDDDDEERKIFTHVMRTMGDLVVADGGWESGGELSNSELRELATMNVIGKPLREGTPVEIYWFKAEDYPFVGYTVSFYPISRGENIVRCCGALWTKHVFIVASACSAVVTYKFLGRLGGVTSDIDLYLREMENMLRKSGDAEIIRNTRYISVDAVYPLGEGVCRKIKGIIEPHVQED